VAWPAWPQAAGRRAVWVSCSRVGLGNDTPIPRLGNEARESLGRSLAGGVYGLSPVSLGCLGLVKKFFGPNYNGMPGHTGAYPWRRQCRCSCGGGGVSARGRCRWRWRYREVGEEAMLRYGRDRFCGLCEPSGMDADQQLEAER
jgi:hypothetical protein